MDSDGGGVIGWLKKRKKAEKSLRSQKPESLSRKKEK